jgi:hypothetical protein
VTAIPLPGDDDWLDRFGDAVERGLLTEEEFQGRLALHGQIRAAVARGLEALFRRPQPPEGPTRSEAELTALTVDDILAATPDKSKEELLKENPLLKALLEVKKAIAELVIENGAVLFHDGEYRAFASFEVGGHQETWPIRSRQFKLWARGLYFKETGAAPNGHAVADAVAALEARALFGEESDTLQVKLRVAGNEPSAIHLDLGDDHWRGVTVTPDGWRVTEAHPVRFRRGHGMTALPDPVRGGSVERLRPFLNVEGDGFLLVVGWLLAAFRPPPTPYPTLALHGEQGVAKSTMSRVLRALIDPSSVPLRATPHDVRDLMISASASWVVAFDNLSHLQPWLSDALCRLATGGGFSTRQLYTDDEEMLFDAQRPVILNGIGELTTRSDLLDRSLLVHLPTIPKSARRREDEFWAAFERERPYILGALLDAVAYALANVGSVRLESPPRMADFAAWMCAAEPALGWEPGSFLRAYEANRGQSHELAVESSLVGPAVRDLAELGFEGTASEMLERVKDLVDERAQRQRDFPSSPRKLAGDVRRLAPNLRALGYDVREPDRREPGTGRRVWFLARLSQ